MGWSLIAAGAAIGLAGIFGGSKSKGATYIDIKYPEPDPIEIEMASMQLEMARELKAKIDDPTLMRDIYRLLPETKMSADDRARFTEEYADITKQVTLSNMNQAKQAAGQNIDDMVEKGQMTQKQGDRQRIENDARINAMMSVLGKKMEASRIGLARNTWLQDQSSNIRSASAIASVDQANKSLLNATLQGGLNYFQKRAGNQMAMQSSIAQANLGTWADTSQTKSNFMLNTLTGATQTALGAQSQYQQNKVLQDILWEYQQPKVSSAASSIVSDIRG
uniref:Uncharacterized protein n=1 Tax=viral metagenome TaxID=1070528 RepID=A0A6H1ZJR0_9ZZZZ